MFLHEAFGTRQKYKKPRVGRGGKRGTTAGKGTKGQKARAGRRIRPAERDYIQRLPRLRGYGNPPVQPRAVPVNVGDLARFVAGTDVNPTTLQASGKLRVPKGGRVKLLGGGAAARAFIVSGVEVSASARKKIEAAGGRIK